MLKKRVINIGMCLVSIGIGVLIRSKLAQNKTNYWQKSADKYHKLFIMMNHWVNCKQDNKSISNYLKENGYKDIAIYGVGCVGETLVEELKDSDIHIAYGIDRSANVIHTNIDVYTLDEDLTCVDAIVVTAVTYYDEIKKELERKVNCPIISLDDILYNI